MQKRLKTKPIPSTLFLTSYLLSRYLLEQLTDLHHLAQSIAILLAAICLDIGRVIRRNCLKA